MANIPATTEIGNKTLADIQNNMNMGADIIYGDLTYMTDLELEEDTTADAGHYLVLKVVPSISGATVAVKLDDESFTSLGDNLYISKVDSKDQKVNITLSATNYATKTVTYKLNGLRLLGTIQTVM